MVIYIFYLRGDAAGPMQCSGAAAHAGDGGWYYYSNVLPYASTFLKDTLLLSFSCQSVACAADVTNFLDTSEILKDRLFP